MIDSRKAGNGRSEKQTAIESDPSKLAGHAGYVSRGGTLIVNADDWGRNRDTTHGIADCSAKGTVSSVSAMVFMEDSERAATIALERNIDAGLHLNLTAPFSATGVPLRLIEHQLRVARYLKRHRFAQAIFHPGLVGSFAYVVAAQLHEFRRLYGKEPGRIDGHHHMHLSANVICQNLLPPGTIVRRNFSFELGEKSLGNCLYRKVVDRVLARRHRLTDYFFSLPPMEPAERVRRIFSLSRECVVELETHPVNQEEYRFLTSGAIVDFAAPYEIARHFVLPSLH